jgi:hypothetical protein
MDSTDELAKGHVVAGRYLLTDGPFTGGAGEVWQAKDQKLNDRRVALFDEPTWT